MSAGSSPSRRSSPVTKSGIVDVSGWDEADVDGMGAVVDGMDGAGGDEDVAEGVEGVFCAF